MTNSQKIRVKAFNALDGVEKAFNLDTRLHPDAWQALTEKEKEAAIREILKEKITYSFLELP